MGRITRRSAIKRLGTAATIAGLAGCSGAGGSDSTGTSDAGGSDGSGATGTTVGNAGKMDVTVGVFTPQSGAFAPWGPSLVTGAKLAKQDLESELGVSVSIDVYDTKTNPSGALDAMKRAVTAEGIDFAQGGLSSAVCTKIGTWASDNGVSYIAQGASDSLTGAGCQPYMYSVYQSNTMMANTIGAEMASLTDKWYLLYADYIWGKNAQSVVSKQIEDNGATVVGKDATPFPSDDYTQYLNNVQNSDAEGIGLLIPGTDATLATKQMMNKGMTDSFSIGAQMLEDMVFWGLNKEAASAVDIASMGWVNSVDGGSEFKQRVAERGELDPFVRHVMSYTSTDQQVRAAVRAGSTKADAIRSELEGHRIQSPVTDLHSGDLHWRACDHQLIQPVYTAEARPVEEMQNDPYKDWFSVKAVTPGEDVARSCEQTGCSLS